MFTQKPLSRSYKTEIKILTNPGLASSDFEETRTLINDRPQRCGIYHYSLNVISVRVFS